jgi:Domain of unknown function (DUF4251)
MKQILILSLAIFMAIPAFTQTQELSSKERRQLQKQLKKEQQAEQAAQKMVLTKLMVEHQTFVLEADRLKDKRGNTVNVSSMINFVACDSVNGVIQIGSNSYVGMNGVGGITLEGPIANYKYELNEKNNTYSVSYNVRSSTGRCHHKLHLARTSKLLGLSGASRCIKGL